MDDQLIWEMVKAYCNAPDCAPIPMSAAQSESRFNRMRAALAVMQPRIAELEAVIESAPHSYTCGTYRPSFSPYSPPPDIDEANCDCWKARGNSSSVYTIVNYDDGTVAAFKDGVLIGVGNTRDEAIAKDRAAKGGE